jgi:hypothetical protein
MFCHIGSTHFSCYVLAKAFAGAVCYNGVKRALSITLDEVLQSALPKVRSSDCVLEHILTQNFY